MPLADVPGTEVVDAGRKVLRPRTKGHLFALAMMGALGLSELSCARIMRDEAAVDVKHISITHATTRREVMAQLGPEESGFMTSSGLYIVNYRVLPSAETSVIDSTLIITVGRGPALFLRASFAGGDMDARIQECEIRRPKRWKAADCVEYIDFARDRYAVLREGLLPALPRR